MRVALNPRADGSMSPEYTRSCQEMKARSLRALLLASSLILSVGTTAMPIMAVDIAPDTSDSGISIDADDG